jgi:hypothetical protein
MKPEEGSAAGGTRVRTALLVDFENIFLGLQHLDPAAAHCFASDLQGWNQWLQTLTYPALGFPGTFRRDLLVRYCYLNPVSSGRYRADFTRAGFQVVDCPPLTAAGKNSADIHIVIDLLDLLAHPTRFDEIILMSSDADYTPVMLRLRAHDRRTVIITSGPSAPAFRAACDHVIDVGTFVDLALCRPDSPPPTSSHHVPRRAEPSPDEGDCRSRIARAVIDLVAASDRPIDLATAAHHVRTVVGIPQTADWAGAGSFKKLLATEGLAGLEISSVVPGFVFDPQRHAPPPVSSEQGEEEPEDELMERICRITDIPLLSAPAYKALFEELAAEVTTNGWSQNVIARRVRDRCMERGVQVGRSAVNFVLTGLVHSGHQPRAGEPPTEIALAFAEQAQGLCEAARLELSEEENQLLRRRLVSDPSGIPAQGKPDR